MLEVRCAVICHPIIPAITDGSMVWSSAIVERNTLLSSDPNVSDVRSFNFSPPCRLTIYIDGVGIVGLSYYSKRFSTVTVPAVKIVAVARSRSPGPPFSVHAVQVSQP